VDQESILRDSALSVRAVPLPLALVLPPVWHIARMHGITPLREERSRGPSRFGRPPRPREPPAKPHIPRRIMCHLDSSPAKAIRATTPCSHHPFAVYFRQSVSANSDAGRNNPKRPKEAAFQESPTKALLRCASASKAFQMAGLLRWAALAPTAMAFHAPPCPSVRGTAE